MKATSPSGVEAGALAEAGEEAFARDPVSSRNAKVSRAGLSFIPGLLSESVSGMVQCPYPERCLSSRERDALVVKPPGRSPS
jgi:hypothetical protein